jgi:hypothetical protein
MNKKYGSKLLMPQHYTTGLLKVCTFTFLLSDGHEKEVSHFMGKYVSVLHGEEIGKGAKWHIYSSQEWNRSQIATLLRYSDPIR